jgi:hypothetical protein
MKFFALLLLSGMLSFNLGFSKTIRVTQIPNGSKNRCSNCHINAAGGGKLTAFGTIIKNSYLNGNGDVIWNATLAGLDSDGDGYTNGVELQDPQGTWKIGDPAPGNSSFVSNPGNASSVPNTTNAEDFAMKSGLMLNTISPNPANDNAKISFSLGNQGNIEIELYDTRGKLIKKLFNELMESGTHTISFDIDGNINSGTYFLNIRFNGFSWIEKLNIVH